MPLHGLWLSCFLVPEGGIRYNDGEASRKGSFAFYFSAGKGMMRQPSVRAAWPFCLLCVWRGRVLGWGMAPGGPSAVELEVHAQGRIVSHQSLEGMGLFSGWSTSLPPSRPDSRYLWLTHSATSALQLSPVSVHGFVVRQAGAQLLVCFSLGYSLGLFLGSTRFHRHTRAEETQLSKLEGGRQG